MNNICPNCSKTMQYDIQLDYDHSPYYCTYCGYAEGCSNGFSEDKCKRCTEYSHCKKWNDIQSGDTDINTPRCSSCGRKCTEIQEYIDFALVENITPESYVRTNEGTYNRKNNTFVCTSCYFKTLL